VSRFQAWAEQERHGRTEESRSEAAKLNRLLRAWFTRVTLDMDDASVEIAAQPRAAVGEFSPGPVVVRFDRVELARLNDRPHLKHVPWADAEVAGALQAWAETHGRSPTWTDWFTADDHHPTAIAVNRHYGTWSRALQRAALKPSARPRRSRPWKDDEIIALMRGWAAEHGHLPTWGEWLGASAEHPSACTVCRHFRNWQAGLDAARPPRSSAAATVSSTSKGERERLPRARDTLGRSRP
jgi:hypothetical protein